MALPTYGPLGINDIRNELGSTSGSLFTLSQAAGFSQPYRISNFYGYSAAVNVAYEFYVDNTEYAYLDMVYQSGAINQFHDLQVTARIRFRSPISPFIYPDRTEERTLRFSSTSNSYSRVTTNPPSPGFYFPLNTVEIISTNWIQNPQNINILNLAITN